MDGHVNRKRRNIYDGIDSCAVSHMRANSFDYIIIGAGSAGCLLANRLSADPDCRVLLIEAGGASRHFWLKLPVGYFRSIYDPRFTWQFPTEPQDSTANRPIGWPRGRGLGGSSSVNGLLYIRGLKSDFDGWASAGATGWDYASVLPMFRRSENYNGHASEWHGTDGELGVSDLRNDHPHCEHWLQAAQESGFPFNPDFNGASDHGVGPYQLTIRGHWRCSAADAFLSREVRTRPNLTLMTETHVARVVLENNRAAGVQVLKDGTTETVRADREVIASAGALQSPHLLQVSGIGPAAALEQAGIDVLVDSPEVGANLQDHYQARVMVRLRDRQSLNCDVRNPLRLASMGLQWLFGQRGPLTVGAGQVGGVVRSEVARDDQPDLLFNVMPLSVDKPGDPLHRFAGFSASACQCRPDSRGQVMARSANPLELPRITTNYLTEPHDIRTLVAGLKTLRDIYSQPAFRDFVDTEHLPGPKVKTDEDIATYARENGGTVFHPSATCRMGSDNNAVLNPSLQVNGVDNLRVIDASAMPQMVSTNTNAATIMIAERGAALILGM